MAEADSNLARAARRVAVAKRIVSRQREQIAGLARVGAPTDAGTGFDQWDGTWRSHSPTLSTEELTRLLLKLVH
jgi:hypothetical protein